MMNVANDREDKKENARVRAREHYRKYRDLIIEKQRERYRKDITYRERRKNYTKEYVRRTGYKHKYNPVVYKKYQYSPSGIYSILKKSAKNRGKYAPIAKHTFIEWWDNQEKRCVYCGITEEELHTFPYKVYGKNVRRMTVDRADNNKPYMFGNMVLSCIVCNKVKSDVFSYEEMKIIGERFIRPKYAC